MIDGIWFMHKLIILEAICKKEHYVCVYTHDFNLPFFFWLLTINERPARQGKREGMGVGRRSRVCETVLNFIGHSVILEDIFHTTEIICLTRKIFNRGILTLNWSILLWHIIQQVKGWVSRVKTILRYIAIFHLLQYFIWMLRYTFVLQ